MTLWRKTGEGLLDLTYQLSHNVVGGWRGFQTHVYQVSEGPVSPSKIWKASWAKTVSMAPSTGRCKIPA